MADNIHNEDSFESFFQKKAQEYHIPYNEEDWLKLEKKLELRDAQAAYRRKLQWVLAASVLIISLLGYFTYENHNRLNEVSQRLQDEITMREIPPSSGENPPAATTDDPPQSEENENGQLAEGNRLESENPTSDEAAETANEPDFSEPFQSEFADGSNLGYREAAHLLASYSVLSTAPDSSHIEYLAVHSPRSVTGPGMSDIDLQSSQKSVTGTPRPDEPRASLGFVVSPDLSTAGSISDFYEPGYKIGFNLEYRLSPRFSVSAGALQSKVRYKGPGDSYKPSPYWNNGITADEIIGICLLIDIPVTFKYNVLTFDRSGFYATAGISSYIMLNEDYQFKYGSDNPGLNENWSGKTGTRHWMSNAGFSIGYEMELNSSWTLRAEPFLRVPLKEVGWGNVKLYSIGTLVSLNYNFLK